MVLPLAVALSGLTCDSFKEDGLEAFYNQGAVLLRSPSESSISSTTTTSSYYSVESGISSMCSDSLSLSAWGLLTSLYDLQPDDTLPLPYEKLDLIEEKLEKQDETIVNVEKPNQDLIVMYYGRNILDLAENIQFKWDCQPAIIKPGVQNFLNNRSQLSRVDGQEMPESEIIRCTVHDCSFLEHHFY